MKGEYKTNDEVEVVDTHFPYLTVGPMVAEKVVLLIRNPFDSFDSYFHLTMSSSHNRSLHDEEYVRHQKEFDDHVKRHTHYWKLMFEYWLAFKDLPLLILRYEDIVNDVEGNLVELTRFIRNGINVKESPYYEKIK
mmetsp:Transcript_38859/g.37193  ORF Transcript_38859/g.37193 Transcript_38859/m.37193 type:complete len:136 (+) Transcript_38859:217-624(+)